ncbi:uncharacterized protein LOC116300082 [Actinia tenebrosa]|uniref:Uncharacterized protein LOC116300082 n=1 Tax=Actinia tenebrosa TaxID=6105 RepID=A0A6P8IBK6_ACTTE|nr:uncharacterized protein LOC116300082 [Actinia tenebrosa]
MDSPQEIALRIRNRSSHSKDASRGPLKATHPLPSNQRRFSEVVPREKNQSQSGRRSSSGTPVTGTVSPPSNSTCNDVQAMKPISFSRSLNNEGRSLSARRAVMLQRQNATTVDPDTDTEHVRIDKNFLHSPPRPPSQPRPKSVKGRPRSGSRPLSGGQPVDVTPPSHSPVSFSKYKPLPCIGSKPSSGSSLSDHSYKAVTQHDNQTFEKPSNKGNELSILPNEPSEKEPNTVHLAIKVLDGTRHERWFRMSDPVADIFAFAESVMGEKLPENCQICTNDLPRRTFRDQSQTLEDIGVQSRTVLYIQQL